MARKSQEKFAKRQREIQRKRKADEKMARRHEKKHLRSTEGDPEETDRYQPVPSPDLQRPIEGHPLADDARGIVGSAPDMEEFRPDRGGEDKPNQP